MELSEDELIGKYGKKCGLCNRNNFLPYEHKFSFISCGYNVNRKKHKLSKIQRKKINFIKRLKYAEQKIICICVDVYKVYENGDFDKLFEVLSTLKSEKSKNK